MACHALRQKLSCTRLFVTRQHGCNDKTLRNIIRRFKNQLIIYKLTALGFSIALHQFMATIL